MNFSMKLFCLIVGVSWLAVLPLYSMDICKSPEELVKHIKDRLDETENKLNVLVAPIQKAGYSFEQNVVIQLTSLKAILRTVF